jgi:hypothetical protein
LISVDGGQPATQELGEHSTNQQQQHRVIVDNIVPGRIASNLLETSQRSLGHVSFGDAEPVSLFGAEQVNPAPVSPSLLSQLSRPVVPVRVMTRVSGRRLTYRYDDDDNSQLFEGGVDSRHNSQLLDDGDGGGQELETGDGGMNSQQLNAEGGSSQELEAGGSRELEAGGSQELEAGGSQLLDTGGGGSQQLGTGGSINALFTGMSRQI